MNKLQELKRQKEEIVKQIDDIEAELEKEAMAIAQGVVGKCYRYNNSNGSDYFHTYFQVHSIQSVHLASDNNYSIYVVGLEFDDLKDYYNIRVNSSYLQMWEEGKEITKKEFHKQYYRVLSKLEPI